MRSQALSTTDAPQAPGRRAFTADRLFDGERVLTGRAVVIDGERIASIVRADRVPKGVPVTEFPGCTLLPGLIDLHVHFLRWQGPLYLAHGVTTIRDVGNELQWILARRAEWKKRSWPRIYTFGPVLDGPKPIHPACSRACPEVDSAARAVAEVAASGVDGIKLYVGLRSEWLPAMVEVARDARLPIGVHSWDALAAGRAGVEEFFHLDGLLNDIWPNNPGGWLHTWGHPGFAKTADSQKQVADAIKKLGMIVTPTLAYWDANCGRELAAEAPEGRLEWRRALEAAQRFIGMLLARGVPVLAGTDVPCGDLKPGRSLWRELALLVEAGMSPIDALRAATTRAGARLGNKHLGRVAAGCLADLAVVKGNPTRDMPASPEVVLVVRAGNIFKPADLSAEAKRALQDPGRDPWESEFPRPTSVG